MKVVRTRIAVAFASVTVLASAIGLTAFSASSISSATSVLTASQAVILPCPNTTVIDYCTQK